jgi:ABC-2 type transport system permease protein
LRALIELYIQQFRTTVATMFAYRASLLIWMIGQVLEPLIYLIVWSLVSNSSGGSVGGYTTGEFAAYYILLMLVNQFTYTWIMWEYEYRIRQGSLSFALLRPVHPIHSDVADNISSKLITMPMILAAALVLSLIFHPTVSTHPWAVALFFPALLLAFAVRFLLEWTLAQAAFWTTRVSAINQVYYVLMLFLSGQFAPLSLYPAPVQVIAYVLPFRWLISFPLDLFTGRLSVTEAFIGLGAQLAWLIVAYILFRVVWRAGVKVYSAVGA